MRKYRVTRTVTFEYIVEIDNDANFDEKYNFTRAIDAAESWNDVEIVRDQAVSFLVEAL